MSEATDAAAIIAAINAQFATPCAVELEDAPAQTSNHIIVFVSRRPTDTARVGTSESMPAGRVVTRYVARHMVDSIRFLRDHTKAALEDRFLPGDIGPFVFEVEQEDMRYDPEDGGWFVAADAWTY